MPCNQDVAGLNTAVTGGISYLVQSNLWMKRALQLRQHGPVLIYSTYELKHSHWLLRVMVSANTGVNFADNALKASGPVVG